MQLATACVGITEERASVLECGSPVPPWEGASVRGVVYLPRSPFLVTKCNFAPKWVPEEIERERHGWSWQASFALGVGWSGIRRRHRTAALQDAGATTKAPPVLETAAYPNSSGQDARAPRDQHARRVRSPEFAIRTLCELFRLDDQNNLNLFWNAQ